MKPFVFFTGDLGFMALEPLRDAMGGRFINAGVAEQNMIRCRGWRWRAVANNAGLTASRRSSTARPFEQIRNDVCLHDFDVKMVGNGGGYGYGADGRDASRDRGLRRPLHACRTCVCLCRLSPPTSLRSSRAWRPIIIPAYLRLGRCEKPADLVLPDYAPWRCLLSGESGVLVAVGPGVGGLIAEASLLPPWDRPEIWVASELPLHVDAFRPLFLRASRKMGPCVVWEEHVANGGAGQMLALMLMRIGVHPRPVFPFSCARDICPAATARRISIARRTDWIPPACSPKSGGSRSHDPG